MKQHRLEIQENLEEKYLKLISSIRRALFDEK
jgi:hypothetical protein